MTVCWEASSSATHARSATVLPALTYLLNLEVDLLFFDTTSTYFELEDPDEPVAPRRPRPRPARPRRGEGRRQREGRAGQQHRVSDLRQVEGLPRRPTPDRDRDGGDP